MRTALFPGMRRSTLSLLLVLSGACAAENPSLLDEAFDETGVEGPFDIIEDTKFDLDGDRGPRVRDGSSTEVWAATREWNATDAAAGMAFALQYN